MNELIKVTENNQHQQVVSARELYKGLEIKKRFSKWVEQNFVGFTEGVDFTTVPQGTVVISGNGTERRYDDYALTVDMAKQVALLSRVPKGTEYRQYLIEVERKWNDPAEVIKRGYAYLQDENYKLQVKNVKLSIDNEVMKPKAQYFDNIVDTNGLTNFRDTAKMIGRHQKEFIEWLLAKKYVYRDVHNKLKPIAAYNGSYFAIKDNDKGFPQTMITPEGRAEFDQVYGVKEMAINE